jgi:hypothetical protein
MPLSISRRTKQWFVLNPKLELLPHLPTNITVLLCTEYFSSASADVAEGGFSSLASHWKENLAMIIGNRTKGDENTLVQFGDLLFNQFHCAEAAHICYLLASISFQDPDAASRLVLLGANHRDGSIGSKWISIEAIQRTEMLEFAKRQATATFSIPHFQVHKFIYASWLAEVGLNRKALEYVFCPGLLLFLK